jgi:hypothetical protein
VPGFFRWLPLRRQPPCFRHVIDASFLLGRFLSAFFFFHAAFEFLRCFAVIFALRLPFLLFSPPADGLLFILRFFCFTALQALRRISIVMPPPFFDLIAVSQISRY